LAGDVAALFWMAIMFALTISDYWTRFVVWADVAAGKEMSRGYTLKETRKKILKPHQLNTIVNTDLRLSA